MTDWISFATKTVTKLTSYDRISSVLNFRQTDRVPVATEMIGVTATLAGERVVDYVKNGDLLAQCQIDARAKTGSDLLLSISDLCVEAEALGCQLTFPENNYPYINTHIVERPSDIENRDIPDPYRDGRMPEIIKALRLLKGEANGAFPVVANVIGPITLASRIMDIEKMLYMIVDHPDQFEVILDFCAQVSLTFAQALAKEGADGIMIFDPAASPAVLPANMFTQFEAQRVCNIFSDIKQSRPEIISWYSVAGPIQSNLAIITSVRADITTVDYPVPISGMLQYSDTTVINGNIKPNMFLEGSESDLYKEARALLKTTRATERFIVGSGCEVPLNSKLGNIRALYNASMDEAEDFEYSNHHDGGELEVTFLPHRKKIFVNAGNTIIDTARRAGITITNPSTKDVPEGSLALDTPIEENMEIYIPYSLRRFPLGMFVPDELYEKSIDDQLDRYGFAPLVDPAMSGHPYGLAIDITDANITIYTHNMRGGALECVAASKNRLTTYESASRAMMERLGGDPSLNGKLQDELFKSINEILAWLQPGYSIDSDAILNMVIISNPSIYTLFDIQAPDQGKPNNEWKNLTARDVGLNTKLKVNENCRIDLMPTGGAGPVVGPAANILVSGGYSAQKPALYIQVGGAGSIALETEAGIVCAAAPNMVDYLDQSTQPGLIYKLCIPNDGKITFKTLQDTAPAGLAGGALMDIASEFIKQGITDHCGNFINASRSSKISDDRYLLVPKHKTALYEPITVSSAQVQSTIQAAYSYRSAIFALLDKVSLEAKDIGSVIISGALGVIVDIQSAQAIDMIPTVADTTFIKDGAASAARLCLLSRPAREELTLICADTEYLANAGAVS